MVVLTAAALLLLVHCTCTNSTLFFNTYRPGEEKGSVNELALVLER